MSNCNSLLNCYLIVLVAIIGCNSITDYSGAWQGSLNIGKKDITFTFNLRKVNDQWQAAFINSSEKIIIQDISETPDSIYINMGIFDSQFRLKKNGNELSGLYVRNYEVNYQIPFTAIKSKNRFKKTNVLTDAFDGRWRVIFQDEDGVFPAIGIFTSNDSTVTGTFLTETGDYRFLEGVSNNNILQLSAFDGSHAFLFEAELLNDTLKGGFWSGNHYYASWIGVKDDAFSLKNADSLTYLKEGNNSLSFTFKDQNDNPVALHDFYGKPTIVQLLGTWCPNCMDETQFLVEWLDKNTDANISIIGLAYEYGENAAYANKRINKMKEKLNVPYPILFAGSNDKVKAAKTLPMLNAIISFPTLIFLDSAHRVQRIHTGFSGPGTGSHFEGFKVEFEETMRMLQ